MFPLKHALNHPLFTVSLLLLSAICLAIWYRADAAIRPPAISNWNWEQHPKTLVLQHSISGHGCSCGNDVKPAIASALAHASEVMILGSAEALQDIDLGKYKGWRQVHLISRSAVHNNHIDDTMQAYYVKNGRILHMMKILPTPLDRMFED